MNTPITDAATSFGCVRAELARRLELDRAALMDALCEIHIVSHACSVEGAMALKAIEAARANFPTT